MAYTFTRTGAQIEEIHNTVEDPKSNAQFSDDIRTIAGEYRGLWPDTGGSANKGDTYQTQVSGTPTGQYFTALQNTTVDPIGDDVNWRVVVSVDSFARYTDVVYKASGGNSAVENMITELSVNPLAYALGAILKTGGTTWEYTDSTGPVTIDNFRAFDVACVSDFYRVSDGNDWSLATQRAVDEKDEVILPPTEIEFFSAVSISKNRSSIRGVNGSTVITLNGVTEGAFRPASNFTAEVFEISGITFQSAQNGQGAGIYSPQDVYLSHWDIHHCIFSQSLRYGIFANTVGCSIHHNDFGKSAVGSNTFAPIVMNGQPIGQTPELNPNANQIYANWIKRAVNVDHAIELGWGTINVMYDNLIENNLCNISPILCDGSFYPKIVRNYFEGNVGTCVVRLKNSDTGGRSEHFLNFDDNYVRCGTGSPSEVVLDFEGSNTDEYSFNGVLLAATDATMQGVVKDSTGNYDVISKCVSCWGVHVTGGLTTPFATRGNCTVNAKQNYNDETFLIGTQPKFKLRNESTGLEAFWGFRTGSSIDITVPNGGLMYLWSNGAERQQINGSGSLLPSVDGAQDLGSPSQRERDLYIVNAPTTGSDSRIKRGVRSMSQELLDFALTVEIEHWKFNDGVRSHSGIVITEDFISKLNKVMLIDDCAAICHNVFTDENGKKVTHNIHGVELGDFWQVRQDEWQNILLEAMRRKIAKL